MVSTMQELVAEALFVSDLQPSQGASNTAVQSEVTRMILRYGSDGCAGRVAEEFGDHPDIAVRRMCWVHQLLNSVSANSPPPALSDFVRRRRPPN